MAPLSLKLKRFMCCSVVQIMKTTFQRGKTGLESGSGIGHVSQLGVALLNQNPGPLPSVGEEPRVLPAGQTCLGSAPSTEVSV